MEGGADTLPELLAGALPPGTVRTGVHVSAHSHAPRPPSCGHLLVEVTDPDCAFGTLLGTRWLSYGQPRHLHLVPLSNLLGELQALGCAVVRVDRCSPHVRTTSPERFRCAWPAGVLVCRPLRSPWTTRWPHCCAAPGSPTRTG